MTELDVTPPAPKVLTEEEIASSINAVLNSAAELPEGMEAMKHLASTYAVYIDETGRSWPPSQVVNLQLLRIVGYLEGRIVALEKALTAAGIDHPKVPPLG